MQKKEAKVDTGQFSTPFTHISMKHFMKHKKVEKNPDYDPNKRAYLTTFKNQPDLAVITFKPDRAKARWSACKYFKKEFHPDFLTRGDEKIELYNTVTKRVSEFDKYHREEKVPIVELMRVLGASFKCSMCGEHNFTYESYKDGRCFILEGEGDLNSFTKGLVLCYSCYRKVMGT